MTRFLVGDPPSVTVRISGLPDKRDDLIALYASVFGRRGYELLRVDPITVDEVEAIFDRR